MLIENIIEYCFSVAGEFDARLNRLRAFISHNQSSGTANEIILREFLARHAPKKLGVDQGFICNLGDKSVVSRQCDILIHDQYNYPLIYSDGPIKVVLPESAKMTVEVKTYLGCSDVKSAIDNCVAAKKVSKRLSSVVFAFKSPQKISTVVKNLQSYDEHIDNDHLPTAIVLFDKGIIIHSWSWARRRDFESGVGSVEHPFAVRFAKGNQRSVMVAFLLGMLFYAAEITIHNDEYINMLIQLLEEHTIPHSPDLRIGRQ